MKNILFIEPTIRPIGVDYLEKRFHTFLAPDGKESTLLNMINKHNIHAVITRTESITANIIKKSPSLKVIAQHGVGVNNIDLKAASEEGIYVLNVPDANFVSVAEHTIMSILVLSRNLLRNDREVRNDNWEYRDIQLPSEISGKNLLIVGFGRIGEKVYEYARLFNMNVLVYDPFVKKSDLDVTIVDSLLGGLELADYVTLHLPLLKSTEKYFSEEQFKHMKESAYFINVSRGPIVDQQALIEALQRNRISGAALDVLEKEPPDPNDPILKLDNVIFTPHIAGDTIEAKNRCSTILAEEVEKVLHGEVSKNIVNKDVILPSTI